MTPRKTLKLYFFDVKDYGTQAVVLAESLEKAHQYLRDAAKVDQFPEYLIDEVEQMITERGYSVTEHDVGDVIFTEVS